MDFSKVPDYIPPNEALDLLIRVINDFNDCDDNEVIYNAWQVFERCGLPAVIRGPRVILEEHEVSQPIYQKGTLRRLLPETLMKLLHNGILLLVRIAARMRDNGFISPGMEAEIRSNVHDIKYKLQRLQMLLQYFPISRDNVWLLRANISFSACQVLAFLKKDHPFESSPCGSVMASRLWSKLSRTSFKQLMAEAKDDSCCICLEMLERSFAILDCCSHRVCIRCAHRTFSVPDELKRRCPLCRALVGSYTSASDFGRFRESQSFKCNVQKVIKSVKSRLKRE